VPFAQEYKEYRMDLLQRLVLHDAVASEWNHLVEANGRWNTAHRKTCEGSTTTSRRTFSMHFKKVLEDFDAGQNCRHILKS